MVELLIILLVPLSNTLEFEQTEVSVLSLNSVPVKEAGGYFFRTALLELRNDE